MGLILDRVKALLQLNEKIIIPRHRCQVHKHLKAVSGVLFFSWCKVKLGARINIKCGFCSGKGAVLIPCRWGTKSGSVWFLLRQGVVLTPVACGSDPGKVCL